MGNWGESSGGVRRRAPPRGEASSLAEAPPRVIFFGCSRPDRTLSQTQGGPRDVAVVERMELVADLLVRFVALPRDQNSISWLGTGNRELDSGASVQNDDGGLGHAS